MRTLLLLVSLAFVGADPPPRLRLPTTARDDCVDCSALSLASGEREASPVAMWPSDWAVAVLRGIAKNKVGPTWAARAMFLYSSAQYDAWQFITPGVQASDGQDEGKCRELFSATEDERIAWVELANRISVREIFLAHNWTLALDLVSSTQARHDQAAPAPIARLLNSTTASPCYQSFSSRLLSYLAHRAEDGSRGANAPDGDPPLANLYSPIITYDEALEMEQDLNGLPAPDQWAPISAREWGKGKAGEPHAQKYATPLWGQVRDVLAPPEKQALLTFIAERFPNQTQVDRDVDDVLRMSANLTDAEKMAAEWWSGSPGTVGPPGAWNLVMVWISEVLRLSLDGQVVLFWAVNDAVFEVSVITWKTKRMFVQSRPIQNIRQRYRGQLVSDYRGPIDGSCWKPYQEGFIVTPPFPDFPSGHSSYSASAATVIARLLGSDNIPNGTVDGSLLYLFNPHVFPEEESEAMSSSRFPLGTVPFAKGISAIQPGVVPSQDMHLKWGTWSDMVKSAGESRLFAGIHGEYANGPSQELGRLVGELIYARAKILLNGNGRIA